MKFELLNTPKCYETTMNYMHQTIPGFLIPPPALNLCNETTVTPISKKCFDYSGKSSFWFDCMRFELLNTPNCFDSTM